MLGHLRRIVLEEHERDLAGRRRALDDAPAWMDGRSTPSLPWPRRQVLDDAWQLLGTVSDGGSDTSGGGVTVSGWKDVKCIKDFEPLLLAPTADRWRGYHKAQPMLLRADPGKI